MDYEKLIATLNRKGYHGYFCKDSAAAKKLVMEELLEGVRSIGKGGSASLRECGIWDALLEQDARTDDERIELFSTTLYNSQGKDPQIALEKGMTADAYICSTNAMTEGGTFINIDGIGNRFQELWHILIPNMKSMLLFGAVMQISGAFAVGTITQELSGGYMSVQYSTLTIVNHMTDYGTVRYEMGYASAIAVVLFLLVYLSKKAVFRLLKFES